MADAFGLTIGPEVDRREELTAEIDFDPYTAGEVEKLVEACLPLSFAMNSLSRCMGASDLYPFILSPEVVRKLGFIHALLREVAPVLRASDKSPAQPGADGGSVTKSKS
jgi:hypothetical protein